MSWQGFPASNPATPDALVIGSRRLNLNSVYFPKSLVPVTLNIASSPTNSLFTSSHFTAAFPNTSLNNFNLQFSHLS